MKKDNNILKKEINCRIDQQMKKHGGAKQMYKVMQDEQEWESPQPLYNIENGTANHTLTTVYKIGQSNKWLSLDLALFGEYRNPEKDPRILELEKLLEKEKSLRLKEAEDKRDVELKLRNTQDRLINMYADKEKGNFSEVDTSNQLVEILETQHTELDKYQTNQYTEWFFKSSEQKPN